MVKIRCQINEALTVTVIIEKNMVRVLQIYCLKQYLLFEHFSPTMWKDTPTRADRGNPAELEALTDNNNDATITTVTVPMVRK